MSGSDVGMGGAAAVVIAVAPEDRGESSDLWWLPGWGRVCEDADSLKSKTRVIISSVEVFSAKIGRTVV